MIKYYFADNAEYSADDVKAALGAFVATGGVAIDLEDGVEYEPSELSKIVGSAIGGGGVIPETDSFKVSKNELGVYCAAKGKAVFSDGGVVISDEVTEISPEYGEKIALTYSVAEGAQIKTGKSFGEDDITLAEVTVSGELIDRRSFATFKAVPLGGASWGGLQKQEVHFESPIGIDLGKWEFEYDGYANFFMFVPLVKDTYPYQSYNIGRSEPKTVCIKNGALSSFSRTGSVNGNVGFANYVDLGGDKGVRLTLEEHGIGKTVFSFNDSKSFLYKFDCIVYLGIIPEGEL